MSYKYWSLLRVARTYDMNAIRARQDAEERKCINFKNGSQSIISQNNGGDKVAVRGFLSRLARDPK
jgi:hypothetical protein